MMKNTTDLSDSVEAEFLIGDELERISPWVHLGILILGMITNPMILCVLSRKRIGSK